MKGKEISWTRNHRGKILEDHYHKEGRKSSVLGLLSDKQYYFHLRINQPLGKNVKDLKLTFQLYHYTLFFSVSMTSKIFPHFSFY